MIWLDKLLLGFTAVSLLGVMAFFCVLWLIEWRDEWRERRGR